ncbi:helix-turn-helix domain-containing protein [Enterococcus faecium]|nr:hypothetical protein CYQ59_13500 [Enterococcus faecium]RXX01998.1 hypothetical protein CYQ55_12630 [Enterococcus faecium]TKN30177.1 helix-turn-helix domain-containing protein [Enterococcus faecium]TKO39677.1 helix-turn-helix domain-containing protein [Enterococcus faecium]TKO57494.1 helix-turn-helix domain-containing protein [Enterococcus faecium]
MCCGNSILQKGLPFFYLHKIFYTLHFGYNPVYLSNKLKMYFDASFQELVLKKKFDFALELIQETSFSLEETANRIGYKQTTSLFKLFKKYSTCTPNEWRNKH